MALVLVSSHQLISSLGLPRSFKTLIYQFFLTARALLACFGAPAAPLKQTNQRDRSVHLIGLDPLSLPPDAGILLPILVASSDTTYPLTLVFAIGMQKKRLTLIFMSVSAEPTDV